MTATDDDQLPMFDLGDGATGSAAPRCRMCDRPARWLQPRREWAAYCGGGSCTNHRRVCQACGQGFGVNVDGAGTKYCSVGCKAVGYRGGRDVAAAHAARACAWCGRTGENTSRGRTLWPYICRACLAPISHLVQRLKDHHVPHERARRLLTDPGCEVCGRDVVARSDRKSVV